MRYSLDTNICIYIINRRPVRVKERMRSLDLKSGDLGISSVVYAELRNGVESSSDPEGNGLALERFLTGIEVIPFDAAAAREFGKIRHWLKSTGRLIGPYDLLIAAHARSMGVPLVTNNLNEFRRIPDLQLENWVE